MRAEKRRRNLTPGVEEMEARDVPSVAAGQMFASLMAVRQMQMQLRAMSIAAMASRFAQMSSARVLRGFPAGNNILNGHLMPTDLVTVRPTVFLNQSPVQIEPTNSIGPFIPGQPPQFHGPFLPTTMIRL